MKRLLLSFLFLFVLLKTEAQITFCPPGAKWNYRFEGRGNGDAGTSHNYAISYIGDSIVSGDTLKTLLYASYSRYASLLQSFTMSIKQRGDTIFMRSYWTNNQWQVLYNYAALPGQSWTNTIFTYTCKTTVNAVDTVNLNSKPVRRLAVTYTDNSFVGSTYQGYITEHIGSSDYLFNFSYKRDSDMPEYREFLCYSDNILGTIQFGTKPCNYSDLAGIEEQLLRSGLKIYPNPVNNELRIETAEESQIVISDVNGRIVHQELLNQNQSINCSELSSGIYFLQIRQNEELVYKTKIVKE